MNVLVEIGDPFISLVSVEWLRKVAEAALQHEGRSEAELAVVITGDEALRELNRRYLGVDRATDVLAFPTGGGDERFVAAPEDQDYLGDVLISYPQAEAQACAAGHPVEDEMAFLVAHGVLHLLGYDDADEGARARMWAIQDEVLHTLKRKEGIVGSNPLVELQKYGQSIWYDNISRGLLTSGELKRFIEEDGILGVTSNPTIFNKAIAGSDDYDDDLRRLVSEGKGVPEIYEALAVGDVKMAADILRPIYEQTGGKDGYVSLEVSPRLAYDTEGTIAEARRLRRTVGCDNVMIKVPATPEGIPAIERLIGEGININVTLIFSLEVYAEVMNAYLAGLERLTQAGRPLDSVASVASFFVSRIDTLTDKLLEQRLRAAGDRDEYEKLRGLLGQAAIASARNAYAMFKEVFSGPRFAALKEKGTQLQRPLWASTSTKNSAYPDTYYIQALIGPDTVDSAPPVTLAAFKDHGVAQPTLEGGVGEAKETLKRLEEVGIDMAWVTQKLLEEGVKVFADSYDSLLESLSERQAKLQAEELRRRYDEGRLELAEGKGGSAMLGQYATRVKTALADMDKVGLTARLWEKDATIWKSDAEARQVIENRLGWLTVVEEMIANVGELAAFAEEVKQAGFTHALLLGMGGSSLCPEVCRTTFGVAPGYPDLAILDTTDPATILRMEGAVDLPRTLFIVSSKAGITTETLSLYKYFYERVRALKGDGTGDSFVAITDPGTPLEKNARETNFRRLFLNPADIGGRYSALSYFGLVPMAVIGMDVHKILERAACMVQKCATNGPPKDNPGVWLGVIMGELARAGRDKVTLIVSPAIEAFGYWAEQLIAESTGKEGRGILPVEGEPLGDPSVYGADRLFVYLRLKGDRGNRRLDARVKALEKAGQPVVRLLLEDIYDLGGEFFRWELATAVAAALLGVNPFDEPNVRESKENTQLLLAEFTKEGGLPEGERIYTLDAKGAKGTKDELIEGLRVFLRQVRTGDYVALMAFFQRTPEQQKVLQAVRCRLRDSLRVATTLGYGPRFLHSTGQLHKGGAANGLFIQIIAEDARDIAVPGEAYTFSVLKQAQALGDLQALHRRGRRVVRLNLGKDIEAGLNRVLKAVARRA
jgi:transaldolase/glucose-6-phosphate isomerase